MSVKRIFSEKIWLKCGIIGVAICLALFVFYLFIYFPIINMIYVDDIARYGGTPGWTTNIPFFTGHFFPFFSGFILEGLGLGDKGLDVLAFLSFSVLLLLIYFFVGALIGLVIKKFKNKKTIVKKD
jgi:hypothetical protein